MRNLVIATLAAAALSACQSQSNAEEGDSAATNATATSIQRSFGKFDRVGLAGPHRVRVVAGTVYAVRATGSAAVLDQLDFEVSGDELTIGDKRSGDWAFWKRSRGDRATITVTMPVIAGASLAGSGSMAIEAPSAKRFEAELAGSGTITSSAIKARQVEMSLAGSGKIRLGALSADKVEVEIFGSGAAQGQGTTRRASVEIAGSGNADLSKLVARELDVSIAGSGDVTAHASGKARVSIAGSGNVTVAGTRDCTVDSKGSGKVRCG